MYVRCSFFYLVFGLFLLFFFFFKQKTAYEMRISDWSSDVCSSDLLSSRAEGFPNVVAEAMATGVACVATDVGDAAVILGGTGWLAPAQNAAALSAAIDHAAQALGTAEHAGQVSQGRERVASLFSLEAMVDNYHVVWHRLAADFPRRAGPSGMTMQEPVGLAGDKPDRKSTRLNSSH